MTVRIHTHNVSNNHDIIKGKSIYFMILDGIGVKPRNSLIVEGHLRSEGYERPSGVRFRVSARTTKRAATLREVQVISSEIECLCPSCGESIWVPEVSTCYYSMG